MQGRRTETPSKQLDWSDVKTYSPPPQATRDSTAELPALTLSSKPCWAQLILVRRATRDTGHWEFSWFLTWVQDYTLFTWLFPILQALAEEAFQASDKNNQPSLKSWKGSLLSLVLEAACCRSLRQVPGLVQTSWRAVSRCKHNITTKE